MKSTKNKAVLPLRLRQAIAKFGADISVARRKRSLTIAMMAERIGVHKNTYLKVEKGDPTKPVKRKESFAAGVGRGLRLAAKAARKTARMYGTPIYVSEGGKVVAKKP